MGSLWLAFDPPNAFRRVILGRIDKRRDLVSFKFLRQDWLGYKREYQVVPNRFFKPLPTHISAIHDRHPVVDSTHQRVGSGRDDRKSVQRLSRIPIYPAIPQPRKCKRLTGPELNPHRSKFATL